MTSAVPPLRDPRSAVMLNAGIARPGTAAATRHRVLNISDTGLCVAAAGMFVLGDEVIVTVGQIDRAAAQVMWVRGGIAGLAFREPTDAATARRRPAPVAPGPNRAGWLAALQHEARR